MLLSALAAAGWFACAETDSVNPGFEQVSGAGGAGGGASSSSKSSSSSSSKSVSTGATGHTSSMSSAASGSGGASCPDTGQGEPNETEANAFDLGAIGDCDGDGSTLEGVLAGALDVDWYKYHGDDGLCVVDPTRTLVTQDHLRICKFAQCDNEPPTVTCPPSAVSALSDDGRPGCCSDQGFDMGLDCAGTNDSATIYIRLDKPDPACVAYTLGWHF